MKNYCNCGKIPTWLYMPDYSGPKRNEYYCDDCVPRGCSCNLEPVDDNPENLDPSNWVEPLDDKGRKYPCCEYFSIEGVKMKKIKCVNCANLDGRICTIKKDKVGQNKPRFCEDFDAFVIGKKQTSKPETTYVPYHLRSRKEYKKYVMAETLKQQEVVRQEAAIGGVSIGNHDCLAKFRSTVSE